MKKTSGIPFGLLDSRYVNEEDALLRDPVTDFYDPTGGLPTDPSVGDRYISDATANGWTTDYIYEWDGDSWIESEPDEGWMVWMLVEFMFYFFFSGGWTAIDHGGLTGLTHDDHEHYLTEGRHDALPADNPHSVIAEQVNITDEGDYYTGTETETALQEIGDGTTLDSRYVNVTGDTMTGGLTIQPTVDTLTALVVNDTDSNNVFTVDTVNNKTSFNGIVDTDAIVLNGNLAKKASLLWGTNTVTLDVFSEEPTNKITNGTFETDLTGWDIGNTEETDANGDWVLVPGDPDFGTGGAFYAMKYEAKYDSSGDGDGNTAVEASAVADSGLGLDYRDLTFDTAKVVSTANGAPIVHITQTQAISACPTGYHLINNNEWMTIARNAEAQSSNWADGTVGSTVASGGGLKRGNVGNLDSVGYNGTDPEYGTGRDTKAKFTLSNGTEIWDMSGNVWNWTNDIQSSAINTTAGWVEWDSANMAAGALALYGPSSASYLSTYGMGQVYGGALNNAFLRGGGWYNTSGAGVFALNLNNAPSLQYFSIGFRCASDHVDLSLSTSIKYSGTSSMKIDNGSPIDTRIVQSANAGDTSTYTLIAYAYTDGGAVTDSDLELWYDSAVLETSYTSVGGGWYRLSGTLTGVATSKNYGVEVKADKTVYVDNISLQAGVGTTQTFNVKNSGTGTVQTDFEDTVTFNDATGTNKAVVVKAHATQVANIQEWQDSGGNGLTVVDKDGNVGIGTTDPDTKLEVFHAGNQLKLSFDATDNAIFAVDTNGDLTISPSGGDVLVAGDITALGSGATGLILYDTTLGGYYRVTLDNGVLVITSV